MSRVRSSSSSSSDESENVDRADSKSESDILEVFSLSLLLLHLNSTISKCSRDVELQRLAKGIFLANTGQIL